MPKSIAIDGPSGSGKGTVSKILSERCNLIYVDTGAMYRAIAYLVLKNKVSLDDKIKIVELAENSKMKFIDGNLYLNGINVSKEIRTMEVTNIVFKVSSIPELRTILVKLQQEMALDNDIIMEGRDITTVVLPDANYKFYLDANEEVRARRRFAENQEKGISSSYEEVLENIRKRDFNDMNKEVGSLICAEDAIYIDSTNLTIEEVVDKIQKIIEVI